MVLSVQYVKIPLTIFNKKGPTYMLAIRLVIFEPGDKAVTEVFEKKITRRKDGTFTKGTQQVFDKLIEKTFELGRENIQVDIFKDSFLVELD